MERTILPQLAFDVFKQAEEVYKENGTFSSKILEDLHSFFGENLVLATELVDKCRIIEYRTDNGLRNVFKLITRNGQYTIFNNINFCQCETFKLQVLESRNILSCKHVLAVKLAQIMGKVTVDVISGSLFVDFLNEQLCCVEEKGD